MKVTATTMMTANEMDETDGPNKRSNGDESSCRLLLDMSESSDRCDRVGGTVYSPISGGVVENFIGGISTEMSAIAAAATEQAPSVILSPFRELQEAKLPSPERAASRLASNSPCSNSLANNQLNSFNNEGRRNSNNQNETSCHGSDKEAQSGFTSSSVTNMITTMTLSDNTTTIPAVSDLASTTDLDDGPQHEKSIFDGASKDEILTYLEDAVERVPELLMATDEVMVLGDSDLLLVNPLDPSLPASQLSIVERGDNLMQPAERQVSAPSSPPPPPSPSSSSSVLALCGDARGSVSGQMSRGGSDDEARRQVDDLFARSLLSHLDQQKVQHVEIGSKPRTATRSEASQLVPNYHQLLFGPSLSDASNRSCDEPYLMSATGIDLATGNKSVHHRRLSNRRKSSSDGNQQVDGERRAASHRAGLQRHLSKTHDSILTSSASTSPSTPRSSSSPGSTSQSRSSSSNHTASGSCSETSNFYTSPSLSCSSPAIGADQLAMAPAVATAINQVSPSSEFSSNLLASSVTSSFGLEPAQMGTTLRNLPLLPVRSALSNSSETIRLDCIEPNSTLNYLLNNDKSMDQRAIEGPDRCASNAPPAASCKNQIDSSKPCPDPSKSGCVGSGLNLGATACGGPRGRPHVRPPIGRPANSHYATINRLNNYLVNRYRACINLGADQADAAASCNPNESGKVVLDGPSMVEFQCIDCDQFILADQSRVLHKANELRLLRDTEIEAAARLGQTTSESGHPASSVDLNQLNRAYVVALNGLPLCRFCEKKRTERKEIVSEFIDTELKYGRDLRVIHDEFYRPMQIAGLLNKEQINGIFSNLDELIVVHCKFAECLKTASVEALAYGDTDYNSVHIGKLFLEQADMLQAFEFYCARQASAACLLARLAKERDLLRIFLRVSQMENPLLRRMNLAAFLMVPVQRVTKYPLLLNRLYKVTPYYHRDREALRAAQLKVELHLEHINHQTKGISATNKIWRRISNLSAGGSGGLGHGHGGQSLSGGYAGRARALISAEDISFMKLRKTAIDLLKWDRDETQFIHSGELSFAPLNEYLVRQKMKSIRYMPTQALLVTMGKPNLRYMPDLVKSHVDYKLLTPTPGGCGIKEAALLLFREKNGRFVACREPLFLSNCVLSNDCSQYNIETGHSAQMNRQISTNTSGSSSSSSNATSSSTSTNVSSNSGGGGNSSTIAIHQSATNQAASAGVNSTPASSLLGRLSSPSSSGLVANKKDLATLHECRPASADNSQPIQIPNHHHHQQQPLSSSLISGNIRSILTSNKTSAAVKAIQSKSFSLSSRDSDPSIEQSNTHSDTVSMSSLKSLPEERADSSIQKSPPSQASRSNSLASASSQTSMISTSSAASAPNPQMVPLKSSCTTILNAFKSKSSNSSSNQPTAKANSQPGLQDVNNNPKKTCLGSNQQNDGAKTSSRHNSASSGSGPSTSITSTAASSTREASHSEQHHVYNHHFFHINHQPYGDYEESFEIHERLSKESLLVRADTPLKTRYWLQMLRYHAKDLGQWRLRRPALANIMIMHQ